MKQFSYADLDGVIVIRNEENNQYAYTGKDGRLYMSQGADRLRTISPEDVENISLSCVFHPIPLQYGEDEHLVFPAINNAPLTRMWLEGQAKLE